MAGKTTKKERNPLDWYSLTASCSSILNGLIAYTGRETFLESEKKKPDQNKLDELEKLFQEVHTINSKSVNFTNLDRMEELINHYSPILLATWEK